VKAGGVAERTGRRRVFVEDARGNGQYLRATWHAEANQFVISVWNDDVCTAAVRVSSERAAELIGLLADGMAAAIPTASGPSPSGDDRRAATA
jgi:hypothetical protein